MGTTPSMLFPALTTCTLHTDPDRSALHTIQALTDLSVFKLGTPELKELSELL